MKNVIHWIGGKRGGNIEGAPENTGGENPLSGLLLKIHGNSYFGYKLCMTKNGEDRGCLLVS
jgi:hypothetical protein